MLRDCFATLLILCACALPADADEAPLTLKRVIELARTTSPEPVAARARIAETRAQLVGARRLTTRNPVLDVDAGPRWSEGRSTDYQASLSIPFDLGRRSKRIAAADAEIIREQAQAQHVEALTVATAVSAYYQVLHADRRIALAEERVRLAEAGVTIAEQRTKAGDVAEFEVKLARGELARAKSSVIAARSERVRAGVHLANELGTRLIDVAGDLTDRKLLEGSTVEVRPDLRALSKEIEVARAEASVARAEAFPSLDLRVSYEHERDADVVLGGIAIALPIFERGQGDAARADARARRAQVELSARTTLASTALEGARSAYTAAVAAAQVLERDALPLAIENETAANASYRAGKIDLGALLVIRREALDTRREHLDRLLDAALAAVDLWIARGTPSLP